MTTEEFSNEFDTLVQSYSVLKFGEQNYLSFDEYEKSVFLTKAQEEIILSMYNGKNVFGEDFEKTEEIRRYLNELIETYETSVKVPGYIGVSKDSVFFEIPNDVWFITYESVTLQDDKLGCSNGEQVLVIPTTQDSFSKIEKNPFRGSSKKRVLRLDNKNNTVELVSKFNIDKYLLKYIIKPNPIILVNLDDLSINGVNTKTECKLNSVIHRAILEKAVQLAKQSRIMNTEK
jgi:hypothetical protein